MRVTKAFRSPSRDLRDLRRYVNVSPAWSGKLSRVDVTDFPDEGFQVGFVIAFDRKLRQI